MCSVGAFEAKTHLAALLDAVSAGEQFEVGAFLWTDLGPDSVNSGREEQSLLSV